MSGKSSLAVRGALAVGLTLGFYVLALGLAAALISLPVLEWTTSQRVHPKLVLLAIVGAGTILWSILPRRDRFVPPGPQLTRAGQPRLFALIDEVAAASGQAPPVEVYLVPDVNAWVAQRGGFLGLGARRVMGVGLALLAVMDVDQVRAVLAHEFGHYSGGDTSLGPWIHKTRAALGRTLASLSTRGWLQWPFRIYSVAFMRVTQSISRQQELSADALSARVAGAEPAGEGLRRAAQHGLGFSVYWQQHYVPVLGTGLRPPLVSGYARFIDLPAMHDNLWKAALAGATHGGPYDSHPPLATRLAALGVADRAPASSQGCARDLLGDVDALEERLVHGMLKPGFEVRAASWEAVGKEAVLPRCRTVLAHNRKALTGLTPRRLPQLVDRLDEWGRTLAPPDDGRVPEARAHARDLLAAALVVALDRDGWRIAYAPGTGPICSRDGQSFAPFDAVGDLAAGRLAPAAWLELCDRVTLPECDLAAPT